MGDTYENSDGRRAEKIDECVTREVLDQCLEVKDQQFLRAMSSYQYEVSKLLTEHIAEMREKTKQSELEMKENKNQVDSVSANIKWWVMATGVLTVAAIVGIMLTIDQSQDNAFITGFDIRGATQGALDKNQSTTEKKIADLEKKVKELTESLDAAPKK